MLLTNKRSYSAGGTNVNRSDNRTYNTILTVGPITVPKAHQSTAFTHNTNSTGSVTLPTGHGIPTGSYVDIYWSTGVRVGQKVGTVSGNVVPLVAAGGGDITPGGDNLPASDTTVIVCRVKTLELPLGFPDSAFASWQFTGLAATAKSILSTFGIPDLPVNATDLTTGDEIKVYDQSDALSFGALNLPADQTSLGINLSHNSLVADALFKLIVGFDAV